MIQTPQNQAIEINLSDLRQEMAEEIAWLKEVISCHQKLEILTLTTRQEMAEEIAWLQDVISCQKLEILTLTTQRDNAEFLLQQERRKNA